MPFILVQADLLSRGNKILIGKNACTIEAIHPKTGTNKITITYRAANGQLREKIVTRAEKVKCA